MSFRQESSPVEAPNPRRALSLVARERALRVAFPIRPVKFPIKPLDIYYYFFNFWKLFVSLDDINAQEYSWLKIYSALVWHAKFRQDGQDFLYLIKIRAL
ncbi:MAG: hypothetical protein ACE5NG_04325 [bacterium]